jgi:hypothetical protein
LGLEYFAPLKQLPLIYIAVHKQLRRYST